MFRADSLLSKSGISARRQAPQLNPGRAAAPRQVSSLRRAAERARDASHSVKRPQQGSCSRQSSRCDSSHPARISMTTQMRDRERRLAAFLRFVSMQGGVQSTMQHQSLPPPLNAACRGGGARFLFTPARFLLLPLLGRMLQPDSGPRHTGQAGKQTARRRLTATEDSNCAATANVKGCCWRCAVPWQRAPADQLQWAAALRRVRPLPAPSRASAGWPGSWDP